MESKKDFSKMSVEEWLRLPTSLDRFIFAAPAQKAVSVVNGVDRKEAA